MMATQSIPTQPLCEILTPVGMLGYGLDADQMDEELSSLKLHETPTAIILDSGSTDSGPLKLATGSMTVPRSAYARDLEKLIALINAHNIPLVISSAGGDGSDAHVDEMTSIIEEISANNSHMRPLKVLAIYSEIPKDLVMQRLSEGKVEGCGIAVPKLTVEAIQSSSRVVAQMGHEPFLDAMAASPEYDVIIGGRAYDPAPYVAYAASCFAAAHKVDPLDLDSHTLGNFYHMGKIMECGGACAVPKSRAARATIYDGHFDVKPLDPGSTCTPLSVAAHTLYEKSRPDLLYGPGGCLDLTQARYEQLDDNVSVRVNGAEFGARSLSGKYTVKLEAARLCGYRTMFIGSFGDPILIPQLDSFTKMITGYVQQQHENVKEKWQLHFHRHGSQTGDAPVFIVGELLAATQALANSVASCARIASVHAPYPGQKATSGNFAFGIGGPAEVETGPCAIFSVYHLMELKDGEERGYGSAGAAAPTAERKTEILFRHKTFSIGEQRVSTNGFDTKSPETTRSELANGAATKSPSIPTFEQPPPPTAFHTLGDIVQVVRSKNSGPFEITMDVMFEAESTYRLVKDSGLLSHDTVSTLFSVHRADLIYCGFFDQARAFKCTFPRFRGEDIVPSGGFMETDIHGSQQYRPLLSLELPQELRERLSGSSVEGMKAEV